MEPLADTTAYLYHHVVLPPKLPQQDDRSPGNDAALLEAVIQALKTMKAHVKNEHVGPVIAAIAAVENLRSSRDEHGLTSELQLEHILAQITNGDTAGAVPIEIRGQNAGILASRSGDSIKFEFFELSPTNEAAMKPGRLIRSFPGYAASIPVTKMAHDVGLLQSISGTLAKMTSQKVPSFQPKITKNEKIMSEERDTTNPGIVTNLYMNTIAAFGEPIDIKRIRKHTREEVLWNDCLSPWRRSPLWLLLRVSLQLLFVREAPGTLHEEGLYKAFMVSMLAQLLEWAQRNWKGLGSEPIHAISAKLMRRLRKFKTLKQSEYLKTSWVNHVEMGILNAHRFINQHWLGLVKNTEGNIDTSIIASLQPEADLDMNLLGLDAFLSQITSRKQEHIPSTYVPTSMYPKFCASTLPSNLGGSDDYKYFRLAALEHWVEHNLLGWTDNHLYNSSTCEQLRMLMKTYYDIANTAYNQSPIAMSVMYLTLAELWISCDRSACTIYPMLTDYDPEVNLTEFQSLVLPLKSQLSRLNTIEGYVDSRRHKSIKGRPSIYREFGNPSSFAVRYFDQCKSLQSTLEKIEHDATVARKKKCEELESLKVLYRQYMDTYHNTLCEYRTIVTNHYHGYTREVHHYCCDRCTAKKNADNLSISIYEWPLSSSKPVAKATVFELKVPEAFSNWRDASTYFITTVLGCHEETPVTPRFDFTLQKHRGLSNELSANYSSRIVVPLSEVKSHTTTHRKNLMAIQNLKEDDVCLENALKYRYYNTTSNQFNTTIPVCTEEIPKRCMYEMPQRSKTLERFMYRLPSSPNGLPANEVIASLSDCPAHLSIDEYKALCALPLGNHILHSNILAQLAVPTIDFSKVESQCMIFQAVQQAGLPKQCIERTTHHILKEASFGLALLDQLETALGRIEENWESWRASATFSLIARRVLNLTTAQEVRSRAFSYLVRLRYVCLKWFLKLKQRAAKSTDDGQRTELYSRAAEIALVCTSTYDVEEDDFRSILEHESAVSILIQASILIQENVDFIQSENEILLRSTTLSWRCMMHRILPELRDRILSNGQSLSDAVTANWAAFDPTSENPWTSLGDCKIHWLETTSGSLSVHINLLTGELLVNGLPLSRLPGEYMSHHMYKPLFQKSALEVVPTSESGMHFSAKAPYRDYKLHFGMKGDDMLVVAYGDSTKLDLVPSRVLQEQLPNAFLTNYIHWYDHKRQQVIFRRRDSPWESAPEGWRLARNVHNSAWRLIKGREILISLGSQSERKLSKILWSLEEGRHIHAKLDTATQMINIELPRLQLGFYIKQGGSSIYSRQYRDMSIDGNQSIGTLVGLVSKLVLKHEHTEERLVLIPAPNTFDASSIVCSIGYRSGHHSIVSICKGNVHKVYAYTIDTDLGRLLDTSEIQSRLFLSYMHAITSACLPDPLTHRTGTESGLEILGSAAVRSFDILTPANVDLLCYIAELSAKRQWYPADLKVMQNIEWDERLPSLSQHGAFRMMVSNLLNQAAKMRLFHPGNVVFPLIDKAQKKLALLSNHLLDQRDMLRSSTFRVAGFGAENFKKAHDIQYRARDIVQDERGSHAFIAGILALRDEAALYSRILDLKENLVGKHFEGATVQGVDESFDPDSLGYDSEWLEDPSKHFVASWCTLHRTLPEAGNRYNLTTWLCTMAFAKNADMDTIQALVAFSRLREMATVQPPAASRFDLTRGDKYKTTEIRTILVQNTRSFDTSMEATLPREYHETFEEHERRMKEVFSSRKNNAIDGVAKDLQNQASVRTPNIEPKLEYTTYLDLAEAMVRIRDCFKSWYDNRQFLNYLGHSTEVLARQNVLSVSQPQYCLSLPQRKTGLDPGNRFFSIGSIFTTSAPLACQHGSDLSFPTPPSEPQVMIAKTHEPTVHSQTMERLEKLCKHLLAYSKSKCEREYVEHLRMSCEAFEKHLNTNYIHQDLIVNAATILEEHLEDCHQHLRKISSSFEGLFSNEIEFQTKHAPRVSPTFWLSQLHRDRFEHLPEDWKEVIIEYALAITNLQRAQRLVRLSSKPVELIEELQHIGHSNWDVRQFPETLLLEAESGILVRKEQEYIASQMRTPENGQNVVLQLLMGGGKSTTIVPILSAHHGDKEKLVRVIVAKPQSKQMLQMLVAKLGGMLGRRVYQMPFSRNLRLSANDAQTIRQIYDDCITNRGVLLIQPEHILSFKLMAVECVLLDQQETARSLLATQEFFDRVSVDCVDESDENFSVKFELIYTMGEQQPIEFAPTRWFIIQDVLTPLASVAARVKKELPDAVDIQDDGNGKFPRIRFLRSDSADRALHLLAVHVVQQGIGIPSRSQPPTMQDAIIRYITQTDLSLDEVHAVEKSKFWTETTKCPLLLLRGLFADGVLRFIFTTKRYRVNFGLDHSRTPNTSLAVPYRSKDSPSPRSEFSHPDVVIILTLLSYYYQGLADNELFDTIIHILRSDQSAIYYDGFVRTASSTLPKAFQQLSGISIRDRHQCMTDVFPSLRHSKNAIDYYLARLVFPKELKQFPQKLSASGWDLAITKPHPTAGFSGTNDTLHLLPLNIKHLDLPSQHHTNAQVLSYLLMDETSVKILPVRKIGSATSDGEHLLTFIESLGSGVRVLLDCGASILEQNNRQVAETWLKMRSSEVQAVVYFENEELAVLDRSSRVDSFQTSPYAKMLDSCLVYLDEAHTRGTDLKLPRHYRAALTLGSQLSKDRLTQAAMRMRKLGHGQAITFIVPAEIKTKIYERTGKSSDAQIDARDVLSWAIGETWTDLKRSLPLWAVQGERFERHKNLINGANTTKDDATAFLENEAVDLETRYKPRTQDTNRFTQLSNWDMCNPNIDKIVSRCRDFEAMNFGSATLSEEQERELAPEIEEERQIERPPRLDALKHQVHEHLRRLVTTGEFVTGLEAWRPAFQALKTTSARRLTNLKEFPCDLLVTLDFMQTVHAPPGSTRASFISDSYQRPVQFVVSVPDLCRPENVGNLIVISPYEANQLLPLIREHKKVTLHLFAARANVSYASLDELTLYNIGHEFTPGSISRSLTMQLNLFAGSLYLRSLDEYNELCDFLGLLQGRAEEGQQVYADGFIDPPTGKWGLTKSPVPFLSVLLMKIRREGEGVEKTHMGKILSGVALEEGDFDRIEY
ncbi:hypothetical protein COCMIDRAFT_82742 [Bipolaris oryzae ATCC 44560]|uniref:ubiquitinyl hydrolase 1 n=1 Tax=Bipolaris oryzae ATCC 44560 TaxID=930090 RepID=W7A2L5_COCMI|nr:uncharacterized protein COCMIDRAFT_82742 [Bipolaris oryzae ATCC 44560]EUC50241.1 hypothetical protein COCMIDRAFT_82742 [Bipolaris oryzae ATCC 44560]